MKANYLFYFCDGIGSVFDSQVLALLNAINDKNVFKKIYLFLGSRDENQRDDFLKKKLNFDIEIVFFKSYPNYPFFNHLIRRSIKSAILSQGINLKVAIFHTRGEMIAWHLSNILESKYHKNILPDVRGTSVEEIEEFYNSNKFIKFLKVSNYENAVKNLIKFNKITAVSEALKEYLITSYSIKPYKIIITPCLAGSDFQYNESVRDEIRKEFNLSSDDLLIVFSSGGTANWQNNEPLTWLAGKGFKVLNLSKREISHKNIINKFVNYSEMPAYLNAADAAIIWRDKSIVNKVASPVKFSEYICCGLPVIANKNVNMINEYIKTHGCGLLIDGFEEADSNRINELKRMDRKNISDTGILNFGIDAIADKYISSYTSMNIT